MINENLWELAIKNSVKGATRPDAFTRFCSDEFRLLRFALEVAAIVVPILIVALLII